MGGVDAFNQNKDPYILANIQDYVGDKLPYVYPPHMLIFFEMFYSLQNIAIYRLFIVLLLIASVYFIAKSDYKPDHIFLYIILLITGFFSAYWNFLTGNFAIMSLFLIAVMFYLIKKDKFKESAFVNGLMTSITLYPMIFSGAFLTLKRSYKEMLTLVGIVAITFGAIFVVSYLFNPLLAQSFTQSLIGNESQLKDTGGMSNPTPYLMFDYIAPNNLLISGAISLIYIGLVLGALYLFTKRNTDPFKIYTFGFLSMFMLLIRIKPYSFIMAVVPIYFLIKDYSYKLKIAVLLSISLFPFLMYKDFWEKFFPLPDLIIYYAQSISLFIIFGIIWYENIRTKTS